MDHPVSAEDSYADRRKLFKNIWDTTVDVDEVGTVVKSKVIKTLKLGEVSRARKKNKQRLKNLKIVCKKILDNCDQNTDDFLYEQIATQNIQPSSRKHRMAKKTKVRKIRKYKNSKRAKSMSSSKQGDSQMESSTPLRLFNITKLSRNSAFVKPTSLSTAANYRKRMNTRMLEKYLGANMLLYKTRKLTNKQLFPINKITIN